MPAITAKLGVDNAKWNTGLATAEQRAERFRKNVSNKLKAGAAALGVGIGLKTVISGIDEVTTKFDRYAKLQKQFSGASVGFFQKMDTAARKSGSNLEVVADVMNQMSGNVEKAEQGAVEMTNAMDRLGLVHEDFFALNVDQKFFAIGEAIAKSTDKDRAKEAALKLLGESAKNLIPLLEGGNKGFEDLTKNIKALDKNDLQAIEDFRDAIQDIKDSLTGLAAESLPPVLRELVKLVENVRKDGVVATALAPDALGVNAQGRAGKLVAGGLAGTAKAPGGSLAQIKDIKTDDLPHHFRAAAEAEKRALLSSGGVSEEQVAALDEKVRQLRFNADLFGKFDATAQGGAAAASAAGGLGVTPELLKAMLVELETIADKDIVELPTASGDPLAGF